LLCYINTKTKILLQFINGMAQMKTAKFGDVDMDFVLGIGGYDLDRLVVFLFFGVA